MRFGLFVLIAALLACAIAAFVTRFLVGWATRMGALDEPNERSSHTKVTPRGGGLSIVAVTLIGGLIASLEWPEHQAALLGLLGASVAIASVSWLDDLKPVRNRVRFGVHLVSATAVVAMAGPIQTVDMGGLGTLHLGPAAWPLTLLWIVGLTNAFNFMDGIDGIAGITAASAGTAIAIAATCLGCPSVTLTGSVFAAAACGFLACNWPPAKIFMGDVGSAFCGFLIASLPMIAGSSASSRLVTVALFAMWPFIFDSLFTVARRFTRGENVFEAHRSHVYQRLTLAGWSHRRTTLLYGMLSATSAVVSLLPFYNDALTPVVTIAAIGNLLTIAIALLAILTSAESKTGADWVERL